MLDFAVIVNLLPICASVKIAVTGATQIGYQHDPNWLLLRYAVVTGTTPGGNCSDPVW